MKSDNLHIQCVGLSQYLKRSIKIEFTNSENRKTNEPYRRFCKSKTRTKYRLNTLTNLVFLLH